MRSKKLHSTEERVEHTEDVQRVWRIERASDDKRAEGWLQSHGRLLRWWWLTVKRFKLQMLLINDAIPGFIIACDSM